MLELTDLLWVFGVFWFGWYALQVARLKELTLQAANRHCEQHGVQLLDATVALRKLAVARDSAGWLRIRRIYAFEFTATGEDRNNGFISLLGPKVEAIELAPHRIH
ncbi:DUF3301 domain-containing protein [Simiduia agarivorans]|uniref:DUF3301 domain-containing protein n=1 Tax=Simiduia agarivorans (strain DSM 21679 / JCM 13881 / BCRC 17597 / SA1) TaxID=1117647 RepID=K4KLI7_SIMAS|nr:DUF3301 domain-containing protein [Simiduia agarivorans]AFU98928.1 hypothetical protein M5M_08695 [Simiduia agarivorans SA1 = DSM 21679]